MYRIILFTYGVLALGSHKVISAPDSTDKKQNRPFVTIHAGVGIAEFSREEPLRATRFDQNGLRSWRGGLTLGLINSRYYQMRLELGYAGKGARELFSDGNHEIESIVRSHNIQTTWLPAIGKIGYRNLGLHLAAGGYASFLLDRTERFDQASGGKLPYSQLPDAFFKTFDYGLSLGAGFHYKAHMIELRLEQGLAPLYIYPDRRKLTNRALYLILHL